MGGGGKIRFLGCMLWGRGYAGLKHRGDFKAFERMPPFTKNDYTRAASIESGTLPESNLGTSGLH